MYAVCVWVNYKHTFILHSADSSVLQNLFQACLKILTFIMKVFWHSCELFKTVLREISENKLQSQNGKIKVLWDMKPCHFKPVFNIRTSKVSWQLPLSLRWRQQVSSNCHHLSTEVGGNIANNGHDSLKSYIGGGSVKVAQYSHAFVLHAEDVSVMPVCVKISCM